MRTIVNAFDIYTAISVKSRFRVPKPLDSEEKQSETVRRYDLEILVLTRTAQHRKLVSKLPENSFTTSGGGLVNWAAKFKPALLPGRDIGKSYRQGHRDDKCHRFPHVN